MSIANLEPAFLGDPPAAAEVEALPDRRELALVAVERTRMPMVVSDPRQPDNPIVLANQAFLDLTGYRGEEVIGRNCRFLQGPETAPEAIEAIRRGVKSDAPHITVELLNYRKDGSSFWNQLSVSPVHDEHGQLLYHFASQKDVTARRRAEALEQAERLLLKEVDHRALNALALVQSIMRLTKADTVERYSISVRGRVDALARAHRTLADSGWRGAELADIVAMEGEAAEVAASVDATGPAAMLPAALVQPLTLVLHEFMINAARHGGPAHGGRVAVRWERDPEQLTIRWAEDGLPGRPDVREHGIGLSLATGMIERQLGGRLTLSWQATGLEAVMTVPVRRARARA